MMPIALLPNVDSAERKRLLTVSELRREALDRLYRRRDAVDDLIRSLENYTEAQKTRIARCIEFSSGLKCS